MNSDNYEFAKSSYPQSVSDYTSYSDKQWNYLSDINSQVYSTNSGLTLVTWDLTSVYSAGGLCDVSDLYLAVPIVMASVVSTNAGVAVVAPTAGYSLCSLKSNYQNLIHQIEVVANGKVVNDMQPFANVIKNFQLLSQLSSTDLKSLCPSLNINECLDNERSAKWSPAVPTATVAQSGIGLCNNRPFSGVAGSVLLNGTGTSGGAGTNTTIVNPPIAVMQVPSQNNNQLNNAIYNRVSRVADVSPLGAVANANGYYGTSLTASGSTPYLLSSSQLAAEYKSYYTVVGNNAMVWYDTAIIPLKYICDCIDKMGLVKKMDIGLRVYFNTGTVQSTIINTNGASANQTSYGAYSTNFANTCPFTINYLTGTAANGGFTNATDALITAGVFIQKVPQTFGSSISIGLGNTYSIQSHPLPSCRCYYSMVKLDPQRMLTYIEENRSKQIVYENFLFNQYSAIGINATFSQLIQSGIKNPIGVAIIPFIAASQFNILGTGAPLGAQFASPYDTCPATYAPLSITNLQVTLGGVNVMNTSMFYTFENFLEQVLLAETLTSTDIGIATGLINQSWWEQNRVYWVDLSRGRQADKDTMRNLCISLNNNSGVIIDLMVFTIYLDKFVIDVETGIVVK